MQIKTMTTGSQYMSKTLKDYGVTHIFFVEAILRQSLIEIEAYGVKRVLAHSEKAAAYMADGYARAGRKPGICMAQSVGAANLAAGLQDAYLAKSPVIAITGRKEPLYQHRNSYQELNHDPLYAPVTKYSVFASEPDLVPGYLRQCFREATTGCPGPVHLDVVNHAGVTFDLAKFPCADLVEPRFTKIPAFRPAPDPADVAAVAKAILAAQKPVLVVGNGAVISGAHAEIRELATALQIPTASSVDGKGILLDTDPLYLGPVGDYARPCANAIVAQADLVIYVGCGLNDQLTLAWSLPKPGTKVIQIDINPSELGRNYPNEASICGDAKFSIAALAQALIGKTVAKTWTDEAIAASKAWWQSMEKSFTSTKQPIPTERLCHELSQALPDNAVVVADTGFASIWMGAYLRFSTPEQRLIRAAGGSLGWSFPASLGVKCALPDQPVICFTGDGGFWYHLCEMETAARNKINTITVLNNNGGFGQCRGKIYAAYANTQGTPEELYKFRTTDFVKLAEEMGCLGLRVEKAEDFAAAMNTALKANRPVLMEVVFQRF